MNTCSIVHNNQGDLVKAMAENETSLFIYLYIYICPKQLLGAFSALSVSGGRMDMISRVGLRELSG